VAELNRDSNPRLFKLNEALGSLIEDYSLVGFVPLSVSPIRALHIRITYCLPRTGIGLKSPPTLSTVRPSTTSAAHHAGAASGNEIRNSLISCAGGGGGRNIRDPDSLAFVLSHIDNAVQYGDDIEPREPEDAAPQDDD
jgi:hypothetical protein